MSFIRCLEDQLAQQALGKRDFEILKKQFETLKERYTKTMGDENAAVQAANDIVTVRAQETIRKKRNMIQHVLAQERMGSELDEMVTRTGSSMGRVVRDVLEKTNERVSAVERGLLKHMNDFVQKHQPNVFGDTRTTQGLEDIIRGLFGERMNDGNLSVMSQAVRNTFDISLDMFRAAGGISGKLKNWVPTIHQGARLSEVSFDEWFSFISPLLKREKIRDLDTGLPMTPEKLRTVSEDIYKDIVTDGRHSLQKRLDQGKLGYGKGNEISVRRAHHRFFHFKDADSWLKYNERFGVGNDNIADVFSSYIQSISRDIGVMQKLGPRPNAMYRFMQAKMDAAGTGPVMRGFTNGMFEVLIGNANLGQDTRWMRALGLSMNFQRSALLGTAPVSAMSDTTFIVATARLNGLPATKVMNRYLKQLNPASKADRQLAIRHGYISELMTTSMGTDARFAGEDFTGKATGRLLNFSRRAANFTNRASGLHTMTKGAADAVSLEFEATLAEQVTRFKKFSSVDKPFREALQGYGIGQKQWDILRKTQITQHESGARFLRERDIAITPGVKADDAMRVSMDIGEFISHMRNMTTNEANLRTRSIQTLFGKRRDDIARVFAASPMMFKTFPITVMINHVVPAFQSAGKGNLDHLMTVAIGTTLLGALALQTRQIVAGKNPRDASDPAFWKAALLQGGGLGLFGDFFFADYSRFGRSPITDAFGGPLVGTADDIMRSVQGNFDRLAQGKDENFTRDILLTMKRNLPAHTLWYSRLVMERYLLDNLERMVDPDFEKRVRSMERRMRKDFGQDFWWRKGQPLPHEVPGGG